MPATMDGPLPPVPLEPPYDPPTIALPPIPACKTRKSLPALPISKLSSASATPSKLRTPSRTGLPVPSSPASSTPVLPTVTSQLPKPGEDKSVRRSVSIAAFPQPPKSASRIGKLGSRPSLGPPLKTSNLDSVRPGSKGAITPTTPVSSADSLKPKKLKRPAKPAMLHSTFSNRPSLLNGSGENVVVSAAAPLMGDGLLSPPSPPQSRSSSAQGSYSTQATTFEEDEAPRRGREDTHDGSDNGSSSSGDSKGNVLVSVRVRPDAGGDMKAEGEWMVDGRRSLVAFRGKEGGDYYYDNVFATHDDNARVYEACAKRLVRRVMEGYHGTVFAYGMTGTGKTFSMQGTTESPGVIPRAITDIFSFIRETPHREFLLRASYLEIYNEEIRDLLSPIPTGGAMPEKIKLREDGKRGVYATPLREEIVQSPMQLLRVIARGDKARHVGTTQYNAHSSRSHAVVQIVVESRDRAGTLEKRVAIGPGGVRVSTLSLIDLAGSERAADSKERRTEGAHINKSLLTLGTVIARLSGTKDKSNNTADKDGQHLPYRDSKLTRLLQPALSGDSLISILCTLQIGSVGSAAPANSHTGETLNTLKFAARAKNNIVSHAKKAEEAVGTGSEARGLLERYRSEIVTLRQQLEQQTQAQLEKEEEQMEKDAEARHKDQLLELQLARTALKERIEHLNRLILSSQSSGVNSGRSFSALGMHTGISSLYSSQSLPSQSMRSSTSLSTLHRSPSGASTATAGQRAPLRASNLAALGPPADLAEEDEANGDSEASLEAQNRALRSDLAEKTRYISTLERRLIQARRTSNSRNSGGFTGDVMKEKDAEIAELRAQLEERNRTVATLRTESTKPVPTNEQQPLGIEEVSKPYKKHRVQESNGGSSIVTTTSASFSPVELSHKKSPFELLGGNKASTAGTTPSSSFGAAAGQGRLDEMSRMLDEMIQEKVGKGELIGDRRNGGVRVIHERHKESLSGIPMVGALASKLKIESREEFGLGVTV